MNTKMLKAAGIAAAPKTLSELMADAKKLTVRNADGSLKRIGLNPLFGHYETFADGLRGAYGAPWFDASGQPVLSKDPRWAAMLKWQKSLVDWYGYDKLRKFTAASADEFGASNDFEIGRVAMQYDGEWRTAFIKAEHPEVAYTTAPFPAADSQPGQYGSGPIAGDIVAIPRGSKHPDEAWLLIKYLASDTDALVGLSNRLKNLPTTTAANTSPKLAKRPALRAVLQDLHEPEEPVQPADADRPAVRRHLPGVRHQVAGGSGERPREGPRGRRQADLRRAQAGLRRQRAVMRAASRRALAMASAAAPAAALRRRRKKLRTYGLAALFLSPWIVGFLLFLLYPMVASLYFSFTHYDLLSSPRWIGLANYKYMLRDDPFFWQAVRNTAWMVCIGLPLRLFWAL